MTSDKPTLAVGQGSRRMTYAEIAALRGISSLSAERLVRRKRWPRQIGNDRRTVVLVPLSETRKALQKPRQKPLRADSEIVRVADNPAVTPTTESVTPSTPPSAPDTLARALDVLTAQLEHEGQRADRAEQRADEAIARAERRADEAVARADRAERRLDELLARQAANSPRELGGGHGGRGGSLP